MSSVLKNKIYKNLETMDEEHLNSAYIILKELAKQQQYKNLAPDKNLLDKKIEKGLQQLNNNEGTDFRFFLNRIQNDYGKKQ